MYKSLVSSILLGLILTACGGNGGGGEPAVVFIPPEEVPDLVTYTGIFNDAAVEGLAYKTETQQGMTNAYGEFIYQLGESVVFSIGGIEFPAVTAKTEITPLDIFETDNINNIGVVNMLRLLQSLDEDGIPENGIKILASSHTIASDITVGFTDRLFDNIIDLVLISYSGINKSLISKESALQHFEDTLMLNEPLSTSCGNDHQKVGYMGTFSTYQHNVTGKVTVIDNCTLKIENFYYDASAATVYFYGDSSDDFLSANAFTIGESLRDNGPAYDNASFILRLPNNKTLDDLSYLSVWSTELSNNFGDLILEIP